MSGRHRQQGSARRAPSLAAAAVAAVVLAVVAVIALARGNGTSPNAAGPTHRPSGTPSSAAPSARPSSAPPSRTPAPTRSPQATPRPKPKPKPPPPPPPAPTVATADVVLTRGPSYLEVYDAGGRLVYGNIAPAGQRLHFASPRLTLKIGDAGAVDLVLNGRPRGAPGGRGQVVQLSVGPQS